MKYTHVESHFNPAVLHPNPDISPQTLYMMESGKTPEGVTITVSQPIVQFKKLSKIGSEGMEVHTMVESINPVEYRVSLHASLTIMGGEIFPAPIPEMIYSLLLLPGLQKVILCGPGPLIHMESPTAVRVVESQSSM